MNIFNIDLSGWKDKAFIKYIKLLDGISRDLEGDDFHLFLKCMGCCAIVAVYFLFSACNQGYL